MQCALCCAEPPHTRRCRRDTNLLHAREHDHKLRGINLRLVVFSTYTTPRSDDTLHHCSSAASGLVALLLQRRQIRTDTQLGVTNDLRGKNPNANAESRSLSRDLPALKNQDATALQADPTGVDLISKDLSWALTAQ